MAALRNRSATPSVGVPGVLVRGALVAGALLLAGCGAEQEPTVVQTPAPAISELTSTEMSVVRAEFCDLVPRAAITKALAGAARSASSWGNGDPVPGAGTEDPGHEVGCSWKGAGGRTARAWFFARPVSASFARSLVKETGTQDRCRTLTGPSFGTPTVTQVCTFPDKTVPGGITRFRHAGLFGDTWLTCEVTGPGSKRDDVRSRTGSWCVAVASTLDRPE